MENIIFYNIKKPPFSIHGLYNPLDEGQFRRLPEQVAKACNVHIAEGLYLNTAGGRVRFCTDAEELTVRVTRAPFSQNVRVAPFLEFGIDLYHDTARGSQLISARRLDPIEGKNNLWECSFKLPAGEKALTLYFPCYGNVEEMEIGLPATATLSAHAPYTYTKPILFYGSSITQGCAASRSGKAYSAILSRRFDFDFINLGFAGSCRGEEVLCEHMAGLPIGAFVSDYDHNRSCAERLADNHYRVYEIIREKHPDIPYYMISRPDFYYNEADFNRRAVVMESYLRAWRGGDRNVYFIDGSAFFDHPDKLEYTQDGTHPTDEGFARMAALIGTVFANTLNFENLK